jgi:hypothetical protein
MNASLTLALAVALGIVVQGAARHMRVPGIVLLLAAGALLGPDALNLIRPATLGQGLNSLVGFAVAVILFEGGLNLEFGRLRRAQRPIRRLVTTGALLTTIGGTLAARLLLGWGWQMAVLFGVLVIVTGPTVVTPLVRRIKVQRAVATVLEAEGVLIDAVGAVVAAFAIEVALSPTGDTLLHRTTVLGGQIGLGVVMGGVAGLLLGLLFRRRGVRARGAREYAGPRRGPGALPRGQRAGARERHRGRDDRGHDRGQRQDLRPSPSARVQRAVDGDADRSAVRASRSRRSAERGKSPWLGWAGNGGSAHLYRSAGDRDVLHLGLQS